MAAKSIYIGYDNAGDITQIDYSDSTSPGPQQNGPGYALLSYSPTTDQLTGIDDQSNGTTLDNLTYGYDGLGRVSAFSSIDGTATYGYDNTSQLVSASYTTATGGHQPANVSFSWDANGNNNAPGNVVSTGNEVTNDGTYTYTFDPNGNRTSRTRISNAYASDYRVTYAWDYRNRLTDVEYYDNNGVLTKHVHYVYDVYNDLIEEDIDPTGGGSYTTTEQFALDVQPQLLVQVLSLSGTIDPSAPADTDLEFVDGDLAYRFLNGPSPSGNSQIYAEGAVDSLTQTDVVNWIFANNQGSPTDVVNSSGTLIDHQVFSPFGQVVYVSNTGIFVFQGFSAGIYDPNTGLIKFGERWYDPVAMIWLGPDPSGFAAGDTNLTRYVANGAPNSVDPSGLEQPTPGYPFYWPRPGDPNATFPISALGLPPDQEQFVNGGGCKALTTINLGLYDTIAGSLFKHPGVLMFDSYAAAQAYAAQHPGSIIFSYQSTGSQPTGGSITSTPGFTPAEPGQIDPASIPGDDAGCKNYSTLKYDPVTQRWYWQMVNDSDGPGQNMPFVPNGPNLGLPVTSSCPNPAGGFKPYVTLVFGVYVPTPAAPPAAPAPRPKPAPWWWRRFVPIPLF